jgi:hypothetical protein
MSTFSVIGFLGLANGRRETTSKVGRDKKDVRIQHIHYDTSLLCIDGSGITAELRTFSTTSDTILRDHTVAFVIAKCHFVPHQTALLEAYYIAHVPGNPNSDTYEDHIPDIPIPFVFCIGHVLGNVPMPDDSGLKSFALNVSEYVRDEQKSSILQ